MESQCEVDAQGTEDVVDYSSWGQSRNESRCTNEAWVNEW